MTTASWRNGRTSRVTGGRESPVLRSSARSTTPVAGRVNPREPPRETPVPVRLGDAEGPRRGPVQKGLDLRQGVPPCLFQVEHQALAS